MQIVGLVNGNSNNADFQFQTAPTSFINQGVISGLAVTLNQVAVGSALISVTSNGQTWLITFHNTSLVTIDTSGTKKVWIEVTQAKIDNGVSNNEDGTGIAFINTGASYPGSGSYIPLASIASGVITDDRVFISMKPLKRKAMTANRLIYIDGSGNEQELAYGTSGQVLTAVNGTTTPIWSSPSVDIHSATQKTTPVADDEVIITDSAASWVNKKASIGELGVMKTSKMYIGETVSSIDALCLEEYISSFSLVNTFNLVGNASANTRVAYRFIASGVAISSIQLALSKIGAPTDNLVLRIESGSETTPSGNLIHANATVNIAGSGLSTTNTNTTINFTSFTPNKGDILWFVFSKSSALDASNHYRIGYFTKNTRTFFSKIHDGSTYGSVITNALLYVGATYIPFLRKLLVKTNAINSDFADIYGFSTGAFTFGVVGFAYMNDCSGFSGMVDGASYYLSNTPGAIATTPGTVIKKVGIGNGTSGIYFDKSRIYGSLASKSVWVTPGDDMNPVNTSYRKFFSFRLNLSGDFTLKFNVYKQGQNNTTGGYYKIDKNGSAFLGETGFADANSVTSELITLNFSGSEGDIFDVWCRQKYTAYNQSCIFQDPNIVITVLPPNYLIML